MATIQEVGMLIVQCCRYFERKEPSPDTLNLWHRELEDLDSKYFQSMIHKFSQIEGWPKNFPMKAREIYGMVRKSESPWTLEDFVKAYYKDRSEEIDDAAIKAMVDPMALAWSEMIYPFIRKGVMTKQRAIYLWNRAKRGELPEFLRGRPIEEDLSIDKMTGSIGKYDDDVPF